MPNIYNKEGKILDMKSYSEAKKLIKQELLSEYQQLLEDYEELESEYNNLNEWVGEQEKAAYESNAKLEKLTNNSNNKPIINITDFKRRLRLENLLNDELEEFIEEYLKYYNKAGE